MNKPDCYACQHRREVPGDAHSRCVHPAIGELQPEDILLALCGKGSPAWQKAADELKIQANYHGIKQGWFAWPMNFDPTWLGRCEGFKKDEEE